MIIQVESSANYDNKPSNLHLVS